MKQLLLLLDYFCRKKLNLILTLLLISQESCLEIYFIRDFP